MESIFHRGSPDAESDATRHHEQSQLQEQEQVLVPLKDVKPPSRPAMAKAPPFLSKMNNYWGWEILSCFASLVALACIIAVLQNYNGRPLPNWPYGVTINTALSFIIQVFSGFMLGTVAACLSQNAWVHFSASDQPLSSLNSYHGASRGIWGSLVFLWGSRPRIGPLGAQNEFKTMASLGCLITILAIGVGPFVQQMSTVQNVRTVSNLPATVGRGQVYGETSDYGTTSVQLPAGLLASIYSNIFQSADTSNQKEGSSATSYATVPVTCSSGECEFPEYRSLAVCSKCYDFSKFLITTCKDDPCPSMVTNKTGLQCEHSLPNGLKANLSDTTPVDIPYTVTSTATLTTAMRREAQMEDHGESLIFSLTQLTILSGKDASKAVASNCELYWCVNTYSARVQNHSFNETVVDTWQDPNVSGEAGKEGYLFYLRPPAKGNLSESTFAFTSQTSHFIQEWLKLKTVLSTFMALASCDGDYDDDINSTNVVSNDGGTEYFDNTGGVLTLTGNLGSSSVVGEGASSSGTGTMDFSEFATPMLNQNVTGVFKALANAITTRIRQWDPAAQRAMDVPSVGQISAAQGTSYTVETQIRVRWAWIALPCALLVMTILFMAITVWNTRRMGLEVWKSSPTALVCSGLDDNIQQEIRSLKDPVGMENATDSIPVRLVRLNDGYGDYWKLERVNRS